MPIIKTGGKDPSFHDFQDGHSFGKVTVGKFGSIKVKINGFDKSVSINKLIKIATAQLKSNPEQAQIILNQLIEIKHEKVRTSSLVNTRHLVGKKATKLAEKIKSASKHLHLPSKEKAVTTLVSAESTRKVDLENRYAGFEHRYKNMANFTPKDLENFINEMEKFKEKNPLFKELNTKEQNNIIAMITDAKVVLEFKPPLVIDQNVEDNTIDVPPIDMDQNVEDNTIDVPPIDMDQNVEDNTDISDLYIASTKENIANKLASKGESGHETLISKRDAVKTTLDAKMEELTKWQTKLTDTTLRIAQSEDKDNPRDNAMVNLAKFNIMELEPDIKKLEQQLENLNVELGEQDF